MKLVLGMIGVLGVYLFTASQSIGWVDSGLIAAAAKTLGIPNPPGFPAYLLIAHLFTFIPWGSAIFKLKLLSQLSAVGISALVFWLVWFLSPKERKFRSSVVASLAMAFSYNLWSQANNIETYTLTNLVLLAFFVWLVKHLDQFEIWHVPVLGLLGGLALGLNPMITALVPVVLIWVLKNQKVFFKNWMFLVGAILAGIIGLVVVYSYLPLRAATHPFVNWGNPVNWERIRAHLVGTGLNIYEPETNSINGFTGQPKVFWESFLHFWNLALFQFTPLLFPLIIWGGYRMYLKNHWYFWMLTSVVLINMVWVVLYYGGNQESWTITSWMIMAVFLGYGVSQFSDRFYKPWILVIGLAPLLFWFSILNRSSQNYISDYAQVFYRQIPESSVVIGGGDMFNSLTAFVREVEGKRRDIVPITGNMFYIFPWYRENLRRNTNLVISQKIEDLIKFKSADEFTQSIDQLVADNPGRTFFVTPLLLRDSVVAGTNQGNYRTNNYVLVPHGLLLQVVSKKAVIKPDEKLYIFPVFGKMPFYLERNYKNAYKLLQNDYAVAFEQMGEYFMQQGDTNKAFEYFQKAVGQATLDTPAFIHRIAIFYAQTGNTEQAKKSFEASLMRDPNNESMKNNYKLFLNQLTNSLSSPSGELKFNTPKDWIIQNKKGDFLITDPTGKFQIQIFQGVLSGKIDEYLDKQQRVLGQLLEQGPAKIPNTDYAHVKVWNNRNISTLEFFLFKGNVVLRIIVSPSDSPLMKYFDELVTSITL